MTNYRRKNAQTLDNMKLQNQFVRQENVISTLKHKFQQEKLDLLQKANKNQENLQIENKDLRFKLQQLKIRLRNLTALKSQAKRMQTKTQYPDLRGELKSTKIAHAKEEKLRKEIEKKLSELTKQHNVVLKSWSEETEAIGKIWQNEKNDWEEEKEKLHKKLDELMKYYKS